MLSCEAKPFVGQFVTVTYREKNGTEHTIQTELFDINFVALKGPCLITDAGDFRLDRVKTLHLTAAQKAA